MSEIPQDVRDLAAGIADDIERNGHYQGGGGGCDRYHRSFNPDGPCCLIISPSYQSGRGNVNGLFELIACSLNVEPVDWNDHTPTPEVIATLRKIAAGEQP